MQAFEYANPTTLKAAFGLIGTGADVAILAGGTDLISLMKDYVATPKRVVNIKNIKELGGISTKGGAVRVGATVTLDELLASAALRGYPALLDAARGVASPQIRNVGTVGGDLCQRPRCWYFRQGHGLLAMHNGKSLVESGENRYHAIFSSGPAKFVSASSLGPALIALNAKIDIAGPNGARTVDASKFFREPNSDSQREVDVSPVEIVSGVSIPVSQSRNTTYEIREKQALDWPLVTCSVAMDSTGTRIVLGHVAPTPYFAEAASKMASSSGMKISDGDIEKVAEAAVQGAKPLSQNAYKVQLAKVAVKRALMAARG
jgi:xanthine dehydrogenase YagS FAD-binding subunit